MCGLLASTASTTKAQWLQGREEQLLAELSKITPGPQNGEKWCGNPVVSIKCTVLHGVQPHMRFAANEPSPTKLG